MNIRNGIQRIFNLIAVIFGLNCGVGLLMSYFDKFERLYAYGHISASWEVICLTFFFSLGFILALGVVKLIEKMVWYVWDGFSPKDTTLEKVSSS